LTYILPPTVCHSNFSGGLRKTIFPQECVSPFKVIQGHSFWHQSNALYDFLLVRHGNTGPILHSFRDIAGFCAHDVPYSTRSLMLESARA